MQYPIVKPYLPEFSRYQQHIETVFERNWLTNNGPLLQQLEQRLAEYLGVEHLLLVANGTLALQVAYAALGVKGEVLTTPFSFAATASSLCWQGLKPVFIDIAPETLNINYKSITAAQAEQASAILGVHVFGNPCEVEEIASFAEQNQLKVIYDAAHAFASDYKQGSVLSSVLKYGDASTLSLHATKLFHAVEGGAIIFNKREDYEKAKQLINFGFDKDNMPQYVGINAKMSEMHAAMGLAVLDDIAHITASRKAIVERYHANLVDVAGITLQQWHVNGERNGAYMPVLLENEAMLLSLSAQLNDAGIQTRRYFYPSLSQVDVYGKKGRTPIANDVAQRVLCLPMYTALTIEDVDFICERVRISLN
ncbi:DegT/DnrJ/EryC1/StrS family aminotransferase [Cognaticolwellia mytili]|uniref:DegT/DnrJ/EryC1/StrS family aminotransferase n=1 Tax=Cognaticolwellia mytili TaxID=1888913 RepID=UPI000A1722E1|nr:DegT/DnrJ/EryC1/StrS family aminotransferase [Cognaticolwellia mytili]